MRRWESVRATTETTITRVASALISGVTPKRIMAKICIGRVMEERPAPAVKKAMTNSSTERVNASSAPAMIAGISTGITTRRRVVKVGAPRSEEASTMDQSKLISRARTTEQTKARLKTTWARMIVCRPIVTPSSEKKLSSAMASAMSGMIIGAKMMVSRKRPLRRRISTPMARSVPSVVATTVDTRATISVFSAACIMSPLRISSPYHFVEKPVQAVGMPPSLKLSATRTELGM